MPPVAALPILDGQAQSCSPPLSRPGLPGEPHKEGIPHFQLLLPITQYFFFYFLVVYFIRLSYFHVYGPLKYFFEQGKMLVSIKVNKAAEEPTRRQKWSRGSRASASSPAAAWTLIRRWMCSTSSLCSCTAHDSIRC